MEVQEAYDKLYGDDKSAPSRPEMIGILHGAQRDGLVSRLVTDVPRWFVEDIYMAFGSSGYINNLEWFAYVRMALEAGYYGITSVVYDQTGPKGEVPPATDHVVLICGARTISIPHETMEGASSLHDQILVSCSAKSTKDEEWVKVREFLSKRGGYHIILVKPS